MALAKDLFSLSPGLLILNGGKGVYLSLIWNVLYSIKKHKRVKAASFICYHYHFSGDEVEVLVTHSCLILCDPMDGSMPVCPVHQPAQTHESVMPPNHLILHHPLLLLPSIFPTIRVFQMSQFYASGGQSISFSISPSHEHPGLISFRMDWLDLLAVQGTLKSLLQTPQFKSVNSLVLQRIWCSL